MLDTKHKKSQNHLSKSLKAGKLDANIALLQLMWTFSLRKPPKISVSIKIENSGYTKLKTAVGEIMTGERLVYYNKLRSLYIKVLIRMLIIKIQVPAQ
jgi:hypothetical protein